MELELGLKITHTRDDVTSFADLQIAKDHTGPLFLSRETETMFFLIAYLKGFRRENIEIRINEEGNQITISGKKPVQEVVLLGWFMHKKDVKLRAFRKVFRIPDGMILDRIKAKFITEEATLTIVMPKLVTGIRGVGIEEVMEEEVDRGRPEATQTVTDKAPEIGYREPDIKKVKEIDQVVPKVIDRMEPEIRQVLAGEIPGKEKDKEAIKEGSVEPKIQREETDQIMEMVVDQGQFEATEEVDEVFHERDASKGILQEKYEEPMIESKEETEKFMQENIDEKESKNMQEMGEAVPERVLDMRLQEKPDTEDQRELEEETPLKEEPPATTATSPETTTMEPEQAKPEKETKQTEIKEPTPPEETQSKRLPDLKEQEKKQEPPEVESVQEEKLEEHIRRPESNELTEAVMDQVIQPAEVTNPASTQAEQQHATEANHQAEHEMPQESKRREPETNALEPTKPGPDQEKEQAEIQHHAGQPEAHEIKEEDHGQENHEIANEIEEAIDEVKAVEEKVFDEHESPETEKQKNLCEEATKTKSRVSKRCKLCSPIVVAGSTILVAVIVFVFSWIRSKKR